MRIYLDNCCYNRHHDKKVSDEITQDKNAVIAIQKEIIKKNKDAYHIASAILAECDFFVTVDKRLLKYSSEEIKIISPVDFVKIMGE